MPHCVLVPVSDTDLSRRVLEYAFSEYPEASFTCLHVFDTSSRAEEFVGDGVGRDDVEAVATELSNVVRETADEYSVEFEFDETTGPLPKGIVDYAEAGDYDLVVMGTHGRQGAERLLAGSTAEEVIRTSPVPVLVYR